MPRYNFTEPERPIPLPQADQELAAQAHSLWVCTHDKACDCWLYELLLSWAAIGKPLFSPQRQMVRDLCQRVR